MEIKLNKLLFYNMFIIIVILILIFSNLFSQGQNKYKNKIPVKVITKKVDSYERRVGIHDGNQIRTVFSNFGTIGDPHYHNSNIEWPIGSGHNYLFELGLLVGAEVVDVSGIFRHIISESLVMGDVSPAGLPWGWEPLPGFASPYQELIAMSDNSTTWPSEWSGWPGEFGDGVIIADQESYWVMDDRYNAEFDYYPNPYDSTIRGLGIEVSCRGYQWDNIFDEDFLIFTYQIKNNSSYTLNKVVVGLYADPVIGGSQDYNDDCVGFIKNDGINSQTGDTLNIKNIVYCYDGHPGSSYETDPGFLGIQILESPKDNSGNKVGLTSVAVYEWSSVYPSNDEVMWELLTPGSFDNIVQFVDNVIVMGSGYFSLVPYETQSFAIAIVMGKDMGDLLWNAQNASLRYTTLPTTFYYETAITAPILDEELSGKYDIQWTASNQSGNPLNIDIFYNLNRGDGWQLLAHNIADNRIYQWNTALFPDGLNYQLELIAYDSSGYGRATSDYFVVNNPDSSAGLEILLFYPEEGELLSGTVEITWRAGTADGTATSINIFYCNDEGENWQQVAENEENDGSYLWDTTLLPNGNSYKILISVTDNISATVSAISPVFKIWNDFPTLPDSSIQHSQGDGDGSVSINIVDAAATTGHLYQLTFDDTSKDYTTYDVVDMDAGEFVVEDATQLTPDLSGPLFDGLRLVIDDFEQAEIDTENTGWIAGNSNLALDARLFPNQGVPLPIDYEICFFDTVVDTAFNHKLANFQVWDITNNEKAEFVFLDNDRNDAVGIYDAIVPICYIDNRARGTWQVKFFEPETGVPILPGAGDVLTINTLKPFSYKDIFEFRSSEAIGIEESIEGLNAETFSISQNYPNPFNSATKIYYNLPTTGRVKLIIYNILGQEVVQLVDKKQTTGLKSIVWDGKNSSGQIVNSGLYIYSLQVGNEKINRKMLFLK